MSKDEDDERHALPLPIKIICYALIAIMLGVLFLVLTACAPTLDCRASWANGGTATAHDAECARAASYGAWR